MTDLKLDYQESATPTHALLKNLGHPPVVPPASFAETPQTPGT